MSIIVPSINKSSRSLCCQNCSLNVNFTIGPLLLRDISRDAFKKIDNSWINNPISTSLALHMKKPLEQACNADKGTQCLCDLKVANKNRLSFFQDATVTSNSTGSYRCSRDSSDGFIWKLLLIITAFFKVCTASLQPLERAAVSL